MRRFRAEKAWEWVKNIFSRPIFAVDLGTKTKIVHPRFARLLFERKVRKIYISSVTSPEELRRKLAFFYPEGAYYWRNRVKNYDLCKNCPRRKERKVLPCWGCKNFLGQELVFDIDPENIDVGQNYSDSKFSFGEEEFFAARDQALEMVEILEEEFERVVPVYSGRGFHIHVLDERAFRLSPKEREKYVERFKNWGIDYVVTRGGASLIRLPYSLNAVVNKEVLPLTKKQLASFDPYHSSSSSSSKSSSHSSKSSHSSSSISSPS